MLRYKRHPPVPAHGAAVVPRVSGHAEICHWPTNTCKLQELYPFVEVCTDNTEFRLVVPGRCVAKESFEVTVCQVEDLAGCHTGTSSAAN